MRDKEPLRLPLACVMGAFVFAGQMLNFTIPGTGSGGHLLGGVMLAALLGPYAGFLIMAAVLAVQALFFADGGLLSLGCNIVNMGFFSCLIAYPLIYKPLTKASAAFGRITLASILACVAGLQLGAFGVVLETTASGISALPFSRFLGLMQPIHLAIGMVEGLITAAVLMYIAKAQPALLSAPLKGRNAPQANARVLGALIAATLLCSTVISWFASTYPDGLEWSIATLTGDATATLTSPSSLHYRMDALQTATALMPDYALPNAENSTATVINPQTSLAGLLGCMLITAVIYLTGFSLNRRARSVS